MWFSLCARCSKFSADSVADATCGRVVSKERDVQKDRRENISVCICIKTPTCAAVGKSQSNKLSPRLRSSPIVSRCGRRLVNKEGSRYLYLQSAASRARCIQITDIKKGWGEGSPCESYIYRGHIHVSFCSDVELHSVLLFFYRFEICCFMCCCYSSSLSTTCIDFCESISEGRLQGQRLPKSFVLSLDDKRKSTAAGTENNDACFFCVSSTEHRI